MAGFPHDSEIAPRPEEGITLKKYRVRQTVNNVFVVEHLEVAIIGLFWRRKVEAWKGCNQWGNSSGLYHGPMFYKSLKKARAAIERFKRGDIIHL